MEGQAILALMAVYSMGFVSGAIIVGAIAGLVIKHAAVMPSPHPTTGVSPDALAQLDATFKKVVPLIEQFGAAVTALNKSTGK
jgi:hypothetical protein